MLKVFEVIKTKGKSEKLSLMLINFFLRLIPVIFIIIASRKLNIPEYAGYRKLYIIFEATLPLLSFGLSKTVFNILTGGNIFQTINFTLIISLLSAFFFTIVFFPLKLFFPEIFPYELGLFPVFFALFTQIPVNILLSIRLKLDLFSKGILNKYVFIFVAIIIFIAVWNTTKIDTLLYARSGLNLSLICVLLPTNWPKQFNLNFGEVFEKFTKQSLLIPISLFLSSLFFIH